MKWARVAALSALFLAAFAGGPSLKIARAQHAGREHAEDMSLAVGQTVTLSAKDVKNYSVGVEGIIDVRLTPQGDQFVIVGKKAGSSTLLLIKGDGSQFTYDITVSTQDPRRVERELGQLLEGTPGVRVRRVGGRFFLEGGVASDVERNRIQQIAALYPSQVESLVTIGTVASDRKTLIRLDFFFIQYDRTSSYQVGIGWPTSFGGTNFQNQPVFQSNVSYDFAAKTITAAQAQVVNQPLPRLDLAATNGWAKILKQSSVITSNGSETIFSSGGEVNVLTQTALGTSLQKIPFGTKVKVLPRFDPQNREVEVKLEAEVMDLTTPTSPPIPNRDVTTLDTLVNLKLGQALILSGIRTRNQEHDYTGLPLLSQIPVLGLLFATHHNDVKDVEGAIFIIPSVIETVPKSAVEVIKNALSQFKDYSGEINQVDTWNKTPPQAH
jgi:pilus assembly protein CpaC